jgi:APA family basic amino acid/polyamine antiporter
VVLTAINAIGTRESGVINNIITSFKILGILAVILLGFVLPVKDPVSINGVINNTGTITGITFISSFIVLLIAALWAYEGWTFAANVTGEVINPKRNIPRALSLGIGITIIIYILINYVFMHVLPLSVLASLDNNDVAALNVAEALLGKLGMSFVLILVIVCTLGAINSNIISLPRKYFRMAQEGCFFRNAARINSRFKTPVTALIYSMIWTCILIFSGSFNQLTDLVIFIGYIFYGMLGVALIKLKMNGTIKEKVFGYPFAPLIFLACAIALTVIQICEYPQQSFIGLLLTLIGIPFYFLFSRRVFKNAWGA